MSHRVGICSSCGANYKVPADFAADKAKCKACGGVVEIGAVVEDPPPPPVPAKPVRKAEKAEPEIVEHVPSGKKGDGPSMMEKLRAKRQAEQAQAKAKSAAAPKAKPAPAPKAKVAKKPAAPKKRVAKKDETISSTGPAKARATSKKKAAPSRSTRPARSRSRGRGKGEEAEGDEEGAGRRTRREKKKSPVPLICTLLLLVVGGGAGIYFGMGGEETTEDGADVAKADLTPAASEEPTADESPAEEVTPEPAPEEAPEEPVEEEKPKPVSDRKSKEKDPMEIDLAGLADFGPAPGCDDEQWASLQEDAALLVDPQAGAAGGRAGRRLKEAGRLAIPAVINVFKTRDMGTDDGYRDGDVLQRTLEKIHNGKNFGWKYSTEPNDHWYNRKVVELWWKNWDKFKEDEAGWLKFTGLDKEGVKPSSSTDELSTDELDALDDI